MFYFSIFKQWLSQKQYEVDELKVYCEKNLSKYLSVETVVYSLKHADMHNAAVLKESCLKFMAAHFADVVNTSPWEELCKSGDGGDLVVEATRAIAKYIEAEKK